MGHTISGAAGGGAAGVGVAGPRPLGSATRAALLPSASTLPASPHSLYSNREAPTSLRSRQRFYPCDCGPPPTKRAAPVGAALREWTGVASVISKDRKLRPAVEVAPRSTKAPCTRPPCSFRSTLDHLLSAVEDAWLHSRTTRRVPTTDRGQRGRLGAAVNAENVAESSHGHPRDARCSCS